jgi:hypothetical protein
MIASITHGKAMPFLSVMSRIPVLATSNSSYRILMKLLMARFILEPFAENTRLFDFSSIFTQESCSYFTIRESSIAIVLSHWPLPQSIGFESLILADAKSSIFTFLLTVSC